MKKIFLLINQTFLLSICTLSEVKSSCWFNDYSLSVGGSGYNCKSAEIDTSGNPASCGSGCSYTYKDGTVTITATKNYGSASYNSKFFSKSRWEGNKFSDKNGNIITINNLVIDGFSSIADDSFHGSQTNVSGKDDTLILDKVGWNAFTGDSLTGNIIWRGKSEGGFNNSATLNGNLIIEDTATIKGGSQGSFELGTKGQVFCKTDMDTCRTLLQSAGATAELIAVAQAFPDGCDTLDLNARCSKCKNENFKLNDGECDRLRWTPAEAAKVLHDDNTNSVTITFKK